MNAASVTIAVPCWSSWKTGMSSSSRRRRSTSKHRGAEMSSRLIPPKTGAIATTVRTISSTSFVARQTGQASTLPNSLNRTALPFHHRQCCLRADVAEAEDGGAVGDDGDGVLLHRQAPDLAQVVGDRTRDARDAGRVRHREVVARLQGHTRDDLELAAEMHEERAVGDVLDLDPLDRSNGVQDSLEVRPVGGEHRHVTDLVVAFDPDEVDRAEQALGLADCGRESRECARVVLQAHADRGAEGRRLVQLVVSVRRHRSPTVLPSMSMSMSSAAGCAPSPGIVMRSPQSATSQPAPV